MDILFNTCNQTMSEKEYKLNNSSHLKIILFIVISVLHCSSIIVKCQDPSLSTCPVSSNLQDEDSLGNHINADNYLYESHGLSRSSKNSKHNQNKKDHSIDNECFIAAVYEHIRVDIYNDVRKGIDINLNAYETAAKKAHENGASILVAPEDGIFYSSRRFMEDLEEIVPEPETLTEHNNNPCIHQTFYWNSPILRRLSCIARNNNIYFVANLGTKQPCRKDTNFTLPKEEENTQLIVDAKCPTDNYFQFNTDVIFGSDGSLLRKYKKFNIFIEPFDKAPTLEHVVLDTKFGKLGLITCFDMMFKSPAIDLVEKYNVDTILFPTWWFDSLPLLTALQFQDAWSKALQVNVLAANIHQARKGSIGSGIYSGAGGAQIYVGQNNNKNKLLLASIPKKSGKNIPAEKQIDISNRCKVDYKPKMFSIESEGTIEDSSPYMHTDEIYNSATDIILPLVWYSDTLVECKNGFCCQLTYSISANDYNISDYIDKLVLFVRNGLRPGQFSWWEQACSLATLQSYEEDKVNLVENISLSNNSYIFALRGLFTFSQLELRANFATDYVYPIAAYNISNLVPEDMRHMMCKKEKKYNGEENICTLTYSAVDRAEKFQPLLVASMFGRGYDKDEISYGKVPENEVDYS